MSNPISYKTIKGLLNATERRLLARSAGVPRSDGQLIAMWLHNAEYAAETNFSAGSQVRELRAKYSISRPQDLTALDGGHAVFGMPLPKRGYDVGDNVPGVGLVDDALTTPHKPTRLR